MCLYRTVLLLSIGSKVLEWNAFICVKLSSKLIPKIVPTTIKSLNGQVTKTNQYSVTQRVSDFCADIILNQFHFNFATKRWLLNFPLWHTCKAHWSNWCMYLKFQIREINHEAGSHGISGMKFFFFFKIMYIEKGNGSIKPKLWIKFLPWEQSPLIKHSHIKFPGSVSHIYFRFNLW